MLLNTIILSYVNETTWRELIILQLYYADRVIYSRSFSLFIYIADNFSYVGINQLHDVKLLLRETIRAKFKDQEIQPTSWNSMYFPSDRDIRNHMYMANKKMKLDQLDQCNLQKQIGNWKEEDKRRCFYLRTIKEYESENKKSDKNTFLYIHQEHWQQELMLKYGHDLCLMDATHKTTKYALPLFFICVKTNAGYMIVGE